MSNLPLVSIVTPSMNQAKFLEETICSVLEQDYSKIDYIICDGGSTDSSTDIIKKYEKHLSYWVSEKDKGQSDAINKGWKRASGEIYAWLNSDDKLLPGAVRRAVDAFQDKPRTGVVFGDVRFMDLNGNDIGVGHGAPSNFKRLLRDGQRYVFQPGSFFRAAFVKQVGLLDVTLQMSMDYDLLLRLARVSDMVYLPVELASFRIHANAKTSLFRKRHEKETFLVRSRYGGRYLLKPRFDSLIEKCFYALPRFLRMWYWRWRNSPNARV